MFNHRLLLSSLMAKPADTREMIFDILFESSGDYIGYVYGQYGKANVVLNTYGEFQLYEFSKDTTSKYLGSTLIFADKDWNPVSLDEGGFYIRNLTTGTEDWTFKPNDLEYDQFDAVFEGCEAGKVYTISMKPM